MKHTRATVSGSFRRHMDAVQEAVYALTDTGVEVLSPADPRVVDAFGDFLFVASDVMRTIKVVQSRHLAAIQASDFLWIASPDGYVGPSAAMELGFAAALGIPIFMTTPPQDLTMRQFVMVVPAIADAVARVRERTVNASGRGASALLDPEAALDCAHAHLDSIGRLLLRADGVHREQLPSLADSALAVRHAVRGL